MASLSLLEYASAMNCSSTDTISGDPAWHDRCNGRLAGADRTPTPPATTPASPHERKAFRKEAPLCSLPWRSHMSTTAGFPSRNAAANVSLQQVLTFRWSSTRASRCKSETFDISRIVAAGLSRFLFFCLSSWPAAEDGGACCWLSSPR